MAARQLAAAGFRTAILDKKKVVGEPVQCAEGVSEFGLESNGLRPREEWIAQRVSGAKCVAPNGNWFYITRLPGYAIDRPAFDRWIVEAAVDDGADRRTSEREARSTDTPRRWPSVGNSGSTSPAERKRSPARFRTGTICPPWRCPASRSSEMRAASRIR